VTDKQKRQELDVDVRFLLANERTLLAWIRTSLAVEAGGIALATVHKQHALVGIGVLLLGAIVALIGYHRYIVTNRSIREHHLPPSGSGPTLQVIGIVVVAILLAIAQLTFLR
jgi:putative membrane protein